MGDAVDETVCAYDLDAKAYACRTQVSDGVRADPRELAAAVRAGARVLETWLELSAACDEVSR